jgi:acetolactate synthase-1/2/3 large subunit
MPAIDILANDHKLNGGCIGTNGHRYANFIVSKADLLITIGTRLDLKQVGNKRSNFAPNAKIYRIDIDEGELAYKVRDDEKAIHMDILTFLKVFKKHSEGIILNTESWIEICNQLKVKLKNVDNTEYHNFIMEFSKCLKNKVNITVDTGQSSIWVPQAFIFKDMQQFFMSAGLGSMGYSLPAAIGTYYANKLPVACFNGDAGIQMNIQELEFIAKEQLPITVIILNNYSMGMIRQFQEKNFNKNYYLTTLDSGYAVPDFKKIANAYGFKYKKVTSCKDVENYSFSTRKPFIIDVQFDSTTYLQPNYGSGPLEDMVPPIDRDLYEELAGL